MEKGALFIDSTCRCKTLTPTMNSYTLSTYLQTDRTYTTRSLSDSMRVNRTEEMSKTSLGSEYCQVGYVRGCEAKEAVVDLKTL